MRMGWEEAERTERREEEAAENKRVAEKNIAANKEQQQVRGDRAVLTLVVEEAPRNIIPRSYNLSCVAGPCGG